MSPSRSAGGSRRRSAEPTSPVHEVRAGAHLTDVLDRVGPGDVAVIDVVDLDAASARRLLSAGVYAVVNAQPSLSGRFPSTGPIQLVDGGVALIDGAGTAIATLRDGERVLIQGGDVLRHGTAVVSGRRRTAADLRADMQGSRDDGGVLIRAQALVADTVALLKAQPDLIEGSAGSPEVRSLLAGRPVLVLAGALSADELAPIRRLSAPVVVAAGPDGRAAAVAAGLDIDLVCDAGLASHPGAGSDAFALPLPLVEQPVESAILLAVGAPAASIVVAGGVLDDLTQIMDQPRTASAGSALTRLVAAGRVVDASMLPSLAAPGRDSRRTSRSRSRTAPRLVAAGLVGLLLGAALGGGGMGLLQARDDELGQARTAVANLQENNEALARRLGDSESFARSIEGEVVAGRLDGLRLVLVVAPGTTNQAADGVESIVEQAGGTWAGAVRLDESFADPDRASSWDDLALRLAPPEAEFGDASGPGDRAAEALAASLVATGDEVGEPSDPSQGFLEALVELDGAVTQGEVWERSALAVLVVPESATSSTLTALARQLASSGGVIVASGEEAGAGVTGELLSAPLPPQLSIVGGVLRASGRVAVVTAAEASREGTYGVFGSVSTESGASLPTPAVTTPNS